MLKHGATNSFALEAETVKREKKQNNGKTQRKRERGRHERWQRFSGRRTSVNSETKQSVEAKLPRLLFSFIFVFLGV